ncbi:MAG TPA: hypothetical protein VEH27_17065 [Methylomirabilota bacterium]|nr:hypothetical protein [Methylomirabilota bacterium]
MSLKAIHVLFVTASTALALFFGVWGVMKFMSPTGTIAHLLYAFLALGGAIALLVYGRNFLRKMKHISYL